MNEIKLHEIQDLARTYNGDLSKTFPNNRFSGNLLLGANYGDSRKIFFTYNPGTSKKDDPTFNTRPSPHNRYWDYYTDKDYPFWNKSRCFFNSHACLRNWISDATSAFLIPWRSKSVAALGSEKKIRREMLRYAGLIFRKMLEHHQARTIIVSGIASLNALASEDFLDFDVKRILHGRLNSNMDHPNHQCSVLLPENFPDLVIFQVPHFSRASKRLLPDCASWLWHEVCRYHLNTECARSGCHMAGVK